METIGNETRVQKSCNYRNNKSKSMMKKCSMAGIHGLHCLKCHRSCFGHLCLPPYVPFDGISSSVNVLKELVRFGINMTDQECFTNRPRTKLWDPRSEAPLK